MKDYHFSLNQAQRTRLETALNDLQALTPATVSAAVVSVTDIIPINHEGNILRGHWTSDQDGEVVATLCGVVEWVDKLVHLRPLKARYKAKVHDMIVGRVIQGRRTAVDELNMQSIFEENDVVYAEVHGFQHDGSPELEARSQKCGKLERGQLLMVPSYLVRHRKQHFHHLVQYGVDLILGCNGYIWVGEHVAVNENTDMITDQEKRTEVENSCPVETRNHICRLANAVRVLSALGFTLTAELIIETAEASSSSNIAVNDMLGAEFCIQTAEREAKRRADLLR
ncbi:hypothetical protein PR202_ga15445 [Eleusine coracana subsp. coracana]|uniref:K Homology domain-containing protein n=1 Tax=Eleusine coracana subsp. coracana TaxID=191504 RepID=A0AAV5CK73_ELECO|nr:hypothetical protein PR202_ga15445 [Eleusine coracana subsp. coracana]